MRGMPYGAGHSTPHAWEQHFAPAADGGACPVGPKRLRSTSAVTSPSCREMVARMRGLPFSRADPDRAWLELLRGDAPDLPLYHRGGEGAEGWEPKTFRLTTTLPELSTTTSRVGRGQPEARICEGNHRSNRGHDPEPCGGLAEGRDTRGHRA